MPDFIFIKKRARWTITMVVEKNRLMQQKLE